MQAGMLGVLWMLVWLGIDSSWDRRGFWSEENLFSSAFYGDDALHAGFGSKTMPGLALYLIVYCLLGGIFALALRGRVRPLRTLFAALIFALAWFYVSFHVLWKSAMPLVYLLYADRPMMVGHFIYGACLARFPVYLPEIEQQTAPGLAEGFADEAATAEMPPPPPATLEAGHTDAPGDAETPDAASDNGAADANSAPGDPPCGQAVSGDSPPPNGI
jgi:hypothetical protein